MSGVPRFHTLTVSHIAAEAEDAVSVAFAIPAELEQAYQFSAGQYLTLRTTIEGQDIRRSYSICSSPNHLALHHELVVGIRRVEDGVFSTWATTQLKVGDLVQVMTPQGRFVSNKPRALHRVGFVAGSGITPVLSIMAHVLEDQPGSKFTLVYGNRSMSTVMFNETLQDLKDRYMDRLTLVHILSRQSQETDLLQGRIDEAKVNALIEKLLPVESMDEVFICGPVPMLEAVASALAKAGVAERRIHAERFTSTTLETVSAQAPLKAIRPSTAERTEAKTQSTPDAVKLSVVLDGKRHELTMEKHQKVLDVALLAGLDLPYSCKGGVCSTCRVKVMDGSVDMEKNFGLEKWETDQGFVLSCQAMPTSAQVAVSFDER